MNSIFKYLLFPFFLFGFLLLSRAEQSEQGFTSSYTIYSEQKDSLIFEEYMVAFRSQRHLPHGELILSTARFFEGSPYVGSTLEREPEGLVVNLREFDCTTLVESVIALVLSLKEYETPSFEHYCRNLQRLRYRSDSIASYVDRLHYFSDWIFENQQKLILKDVTKELGGKSCNFSLHFMSKNFTKYKALSDNPELIPLMVMKEREISSRKNYYFLPKEQIAEHSSKMQNGDIVCFVTNIAGLDILHVGIVSKLGERVSFVHASSLSSKVLLQPGTLAGYCKASKVLVGVIVLRL